MLDLDRLYDNQNILDKTYLIGEKGILASNDFPRCILLR